jgi:dihydroorotase
MYTTVFDEDNALDSLGAFLSENFLSLYGMEVSVQMMTIKRELLAVPQKVDPVQVFKGSTELQWKLVG